MVSQIKQIVRLAGFACMLFMLPAMAGNKTAQYSLFNAIDRADVQGVKSALNEGAKADEVHEAYFCDAIGYTTRKIFDTPNNGRTAEIATKFLSFVGANTYIYKNIDSLANHASKNIFRVKDLVSLQQSIRNHNLLVCLKALGILAAGKFMAPFVCSAVNKVSTRKGRLREILTILQNAAPNRSAFEKITRY